MVTPETVNDVLSPTRIMYLPLSGTSNNNPGGTLDQGLVHRGQRWAGVRMEGDAMFVKHPDMSLCVQANPARAHRYNVHARSVGLLRCTRHREDPCRKDVVLAIQNAQREKENAQKNRPT